MILSRPQVIGKLFALWNMNQQVYLRNTVPDQEL